MKPKTASRLLLLILVLCFAAGAYEIRRAWLEHAGSHGPAAPPPLGLPEAPARTMQRIKLGS